MGAKAARAFLRRRHEFGSHGIRKVVLENFLDFAEIVEILMPEYSKTTGCR